MYLKLKMKNNIYLKAFTLVELLVSMAIIDILIGLALYGIGAAQRNSRDTARKSIVQDIGTSIQNYHTDYGEFPQYYSFNGDKLYMSSGTCSANDICTIIELDGVTKATAGGSIFDSNIVTNPTADTNETQYCIDVNGVNDKDGLYMVSVKLENGKIYSVDPKRTHCF